MELSRRCLPGCLPCRVGGAGWLAGSAAGGSGGAGVLGFSLKKVRHFSPICGCPLPAAFCCAGCAGCAAPAAWPAAACAGSCAGSWHIVCGDGCGAMAVAAGSSGVFCSSCSCGAACCNMASRFRASSAEGAAGPLSGPTTDRGGWGEAAPAAAAACFVAGTNVATCELAA
eukprot:10750132-Alexandrium_andersonii.AAC.1